MSAVPLPMKWTSDQYLQLVEQGVFDGKQVELAFGDILTKMSPSGSAHVNTVLRLTRELTKAFPNRGVGIQCTLRISDSSVLDPDAWVTKQDQDSYIGDEFKADDIDLVVEVSDSSLRFDREQKQRIYASAAIPEYWIINILDRTVEVYSQPEGDQYLIKVISGSNDSINSPAFGAMAITTSRLFPKA